MSETCDTCGEVEQDGYLDEKGRCKQCSPHWPHREPTEPSYR